MKLTSAICKFHYFIKGGIISIFLYSPKYRKTSYFRKPFGEGYKWAIDDWHFRRTTGKNKGVPWPVAPGTDVPHPENIVFEPEDLRIFNGTGIYFQGIGAKTIIGKNCWIARNVGLITSNHDLSDPTKHMPAKNIVLGDYCWIGMNVVIMPGVVLGPHTVVGAGAIVTKSFEEGYCVVAGNPARVIKEIPKLEE